MSTLKPSKEENPHLEELRARTAKAPSSPGIYRWLNKEGDVLYVGKAKNLRNRLTSYVQKNPDSGMGPWKLSLLTRIADLDITVTNSELEALILETNLIKELKPKYNVLMKDDKNYVYVRISVQDPYPDVSIVRRLEEDGAKYFGPFLSSYHTRKMLDVLQEVFHYRENKQALERLNRAAKKGEDGSVQAAPSLEFQIGQSCGVAMGKISREEYRERIRSVVAFFKGDHAHVLKQAKAAMQQAAENKKFERAAALRDAVEFVEGMKEEQLVSDTSGEDTDTFAVAMSGSKALIMLLKERGGKLTGEQSFSLRGEPDCAAVALEQFLPQYYLSVPYLPDLVVVGEELEDAPLLSKWMSERKGKAVEIRKPERGKKSKVLELAEKNAAEKVHQLEAKWESAARNIESALTDLQTVLKLEIIPKRIEGYDISHLGGTETVGSMVVVQNGKPANTQYRSFTIQTLREGDIDDYKALEEVLRRRLKYLMTTVKQEEVVWKSKGITLGKARKGEQKSIEEIIEKQKELSNVGIEYKDFIVARHGKEIVAFARLVEAETVTPEIKSLWVEEKYRGEKLGRLLVRKILGRVKKGKIYVIIDPNPKLEEYYAEIGFRHVLSPPESLLKKTRAFCKEQLDAREGRILVYIVSEHKADDSLASKPDLLVIDGGKGQLSSALKVLKEAGLNIPVIGLAKREEEIFAPGEKNPLLLPKDSQAQFLLQRLRNEAHRFANEHRKKRMAKHAIGSALDDVPGIGIKTKQALLLEFGSVQHIQEASDKALRTLVSDTQLQALRKYL